MLDLEDLILNSISFPCLKASSLLTDANLFEFIWDGLLDISSVESLPLVTLLILPGAHEVTICLLASFKSGLVKVIIINDHAKLKHFGVLHWKYIFHCDGSHTLDWHTF